MAHNVKCVYCQASFDRDKESYILVGKRRYAHRRCADPTVRENLGALEDYIKQLFGYEEIPDAVQQQIDNYIRFDGYSYVGILKTLQYCYEVKHLSLERSGGRIGIVKYIYDESEKYYKKLEEMRATNKELSARQEFITTNTNTEEIHIETPKRQKGGFRKLFSFLEGGYSNE